MLPNDKHETVARREKVQCTQHRKMTRLVKVVCMCGKRMVLEKKNDNGKIKQCDIYVISCNFLLVLILIIKIFFVFACNLQIILKNSCILGNNSLKIQGRHQKI